jgi:energy-coupling factor transport system permease protein
VITVLQVALNRQGPILVHFGPLQLTVEGLVRGIYLGARFLVVVLISYLFVLTTAPDQLAYALMQAGLPYRFGFTLVTALRLIPIFEGEALTVYRAQLVRGVSYKGKDWRGFWNNLQSYLLPLLVSAIQKVDALSISMEGRCYGMYHTRTYFRTRERYRGDWLAGFGLVLVLFAALYFKHWEG